MSQSLPSTQIKQLSKLEETFALSYVWMLFADS